ncbi:MAG TPA: patatin-like phospholipase family protein [Peptococcaceae bacterium]|nr:patatin-like phospholipase family protein [Peptococcaceae bacterium]
MYGLVLEGGGARGSYQIGAFKALQELGVEVNAVTGTSIGALNGAMIVQGQLERAYELWYNISPYQVFDIEESRLLELKNLEISHDGLLYFMKKAKEIAQDKGLDITFIKKLLQENIQESKLRKSKVLFGFVTISLTDLKPLELFLEDIPEGKVIEYLLASANLPAFKQEKIDGKRYMDGGFYDNLPLNMLVKKGYRDIIAIRTKAPGRTRKVLNPNVKVKYIATDENLGGILDFNQDQARFNLQLGYFDAYRQWQGLKGRKYYLRPTGDEEFFMNFLLAPGEKAILRLGQSLGLTGIPYRRLLFEHIIPKFALLLDLSKESSYEDLVIAILELVAADNKVERFKIYSFNDFLAAIRKNCRDGKFVNVGESPRLPLFVKQSDILARAVKDKVVREMVNGLFGEYLNEMEVAH